MKYLFIDLEYASCKNGRKKICEFGYVITNEQFDVLKRGNFIINPNILICDWDWYAVRKILTRDINVYEKSCTFDRYYKQILDLINSADYVFGHSFSGDVVALNDECQRYGLECINFSFYDIKNIYKEYSGKNIDISVTYILQSLEIDGEENIHDAEADAVNTMNCLKGIINNLNFTIDELLELVPNAIDSNVDFNINSSVIAKSKRLELYKEIVLNNKDNLMKTFSRERRIFNDFLSKVKSESKNKRTLKGIKCCISLNYEITHFKQMFNIVQLLVNKGAKYVTKASECNLFVECEMYSETGNSRSCVRTKYVKETIGNGKNIKIINFNELMSLLEITEDKLNLMPMVNIEEIFNFKDNTSSCRTNINDLFGDILLSFR